MSRRRGRGTRGDDRLAASLDQAIAGIGGRAHRAKASPPAARTTYSLTQAAAILEVHRNTLAKWLDQGAPAAQRADRVRGLEWELSIADIVDWRIRKAVDDALAAYQGDGPAGLIAEAEAKRRKAVAEAIVAEIEADEALRHVVGVADVTDAVTALFARIRSLMTGLGAKIAGRAATMTSAPAIQALVDAELRLALAPLDDPSMLSRVGLDDMADELERGGHGRDDDLGAPQPA